MSIFEEDKKYIANTYSRFPLNIVSGKGSQAYDGNGREYIDLSTGIAVNTFGFADPEWIAAVSGQMSLFQHTSNLYYSQPCVSLAKLLCERTGMSKVFFCNSGAEANECAIKAARKYAAKKGSGRFNIVTLCNSFHGRTITTLAATGQDAFHKDFLPLTEGFVYAEANNVADLEKKISECDPCAVMFEPVQGEGGVIPLDPGFVGAMIRIAEEKDILLICDEVQTGNGRTGKLYGYMNYGITPDIVSTAKGLGGGLPIGATLLSEKVQDVFGYGDHGSTFGGNPLSCAGALSIISRIDEALLSGVQRKSKLIFDTLSGQPGIISVTGLGLMIGIETVRPAGEIISECMEKGVLVIKAKNKLRLLPALNIPDELLIKALDIIKTCAAKI